MASYSETKTYDRLVSSTFERNEQGVQDAIHKATPFLAWCKENDRLKTVDGGERISVPLMYGLNTTIKSMAKQDNIDTTPQDGVTKAFFNWKYITGSVVIWDADLMMNKGSKTKVFDILDTGREQLVMSVAQEWTRQSFLDGTGNGSLDILGLQAIVATDPTTGTLAGINRANETWWRNQYNASVGSFAANGLTKTRNLYNSCSLGGAKGSPDLGLTTQSIYESFENLYVLALQFRKEDQKMADLHFDNFKFGGATIMFDEQAPSGNFYFLNSKYIYPVVHEDGNFQIMPKRMTHNQFATIIPFLMMGTIVSNNCRKLGVNSGIS